MSDSEAGRPPDPRVTDEPGETGDSSAGARPRRHGRFTARWRDLPPVEPGELSTRIWDDLADWEGSGHEAGAGEDLDLGSDREGRDAAGAAEATSAPEPSAPPAPSPPLSPDASARFEPRLLEEVSRQTARLDRLETEWRRTLREIGKGLANVSAEMWRRLDATLRTELGRMAASLEATLEQHGVGEEAWRGLEETLRDLRERTERLSEHVIQLERRQSESLATQRKALVAAAGDVVSASTDETLRGLRKVEQRMQAHVAEAIGEVRGAHNATARKVDQASRDLARLVKAATAELQKEIGALAQAAASGDTSDEPASGPSRPRAG